MKHFTFSEALFNQILAGNKTQHREVVSLKNPHSKNELQYFDKEYSLAWFRHPSGYYDQEISKKNLGDICYLKEPYSIDYHNGDLPYSGYNYKYDNYQTQIGNNWKNADSMTEKSARYFVKITDVRIERLQEISEEDSISEGIEQWRVIINEPTFILYGNPNESRTNLPVLSFKTLWQSIHKVASRWEDNPFVWVYDFELMDKSEVYK